MALTNGRSNGVIKATVNVKGSRVTVHRVRERATAQLVHCPSCAELLQLEEIDGGHVPIGRLFECLGCHARLRLSHDGIAVEVKR